MKLIPKIPAPYLKTGKGSNVTYIFKRDLGKKMSFGMWTGIVPYRLWTWALKTLLIVPPQRLLCDPNVTRGQVAGWNSSWIKNRKQKSRNKCSVLTLEREVGFPQELYWDLNYLELGEMMSFPENTKLSGVVKMQGDFQAPKRSIKTEWMSINTAKAIHCKKV